MSRLTGILLLAAWPVWGQTLTVSLAKTNIPAGERVAVRIRVMRNNAQATDWSGFVRVSASGVRFRGKAGYALKSSDDADVDRTDAAEVFLNAGTNAMLNLSSFVPGEYTLRVEDLYGRVAAARLVFRVVPAAGRLLFSEVMFKTDSPTLRYVELYNPGPSSVVLSNLKLVRYSSSVSSVTSAAFFNSTGSAVLAAGGYAVVPADLGVLSAWFPQVADAGILKTNPFSSALSSAGSHLLLLRNGVLEDACEYESDWTEKDVALERVSFAAPAAGKSAWTPSVAASAVSASVRGSPGKANPGLRRTDRDVALRLEPARSTLKVAEGPVKVTVGADRPGLLSLSLLDGQGRVVMWLLRRQACGAGVPVEAWLDGRGMSAGLYVLRLEYTDEAAGLRSLRHAPLVVGW